MLAACGPVFGEEGAGFLEEDVETGLAFEDYVIVAGQFHELSAGDQPREQAALEDRRDPVTGDVHDKRRHPDLPGDFGHVVIIGIWAAFSGLVEIR